VVHTYCNAWVLTNFIQGKQAKQLSLSTLWRHVGGAEEQLHSKTLALDECQWLTSHPSCFNPGKEPWYIFNKMLGALPRGVDVLEKRNIFSPYQDLNPGSSSQ